MKKVTAKRILDHLKALFDEEVSEAGGRLAKAQLAEGEGLQEAAAVLRGVAFDEARHATVIARLMPEKVFEGTRSNITAAIDADSDAAEREKRFAQTAREAGMEEAAKVLEELSNDEMDHVIRLREVLNKLNQAAAQ